MFSDKFVREAPRLHYRYHPIGTGRGSDDSNEKPLPMTKVVTRPGHLSYSLKHPSSCSSSLYKNIKRRESTMLSHPLLKKRSSTQKNHLVLAKASYHPPPLYYSSMKHASEARPAPDLISQKLTALQLSRSKPVFSAPAQVVDRKGIELPVPSGGSCKARNIASCQRNRSTISILRATPHMDCPGSSIEGAPNPSGPSETDQSSDVTPYDFSLGEEDFEDCASSECSLLDSKSSCDDEETLCSSLQQSEKSSCDGGGHFNKMFLMEVKRRRERDFGQICSSSTTMNENDLECDSQGAAEEVERRLRSSSKEDEIHDELCCKGESSPDQKERSDSSWAAEGLSQCQVPVASSLLNLPGNSDSREPSPPLTLSIFPEYFTPTIHFPLHNENYLPLSRDKQALLKWKVSSITPNIVKNCSARVGFTKCTRGDMWMGYWGKHMKGESFKIIKEYQKINHFPGTFQIGRKDRLWRNLNRLQSRVGKKNCNFVPQTYVLPQDLALLKKEWEEGGRSKWILKPPASARGIGIKVVNKWKDVPKKKPVIVQRYISNPYLINGMKFDLRIYVLVSSYEPLKIYIFREGLARFATCKYSSAMKHISNRFMHLTNYSINKHSTDFTPNTDETVCQGHKWGLLALWKYMSLELGVDTQAVWESVKDVVIKTIISSEQYVSSNIKAYVRHSSSVYELFGFDIMLDNNLKPWILEVNISPSLHSNSQLDINIKGRLVRDVFNICGFKLYCKQILCGHEKLSRPPSLTPEERSKHSHFIQRSLKKEERRKILDKLTVDDVRALMAAEDELSRCGYFERAFPSFKSDQLYRRFFEAEKYYNVLLGEWAERYESCPKKGLRLLRKAASDLNLATVN